MRDKASIIEKERVNSEKGRVNKGQEEPIIGQIATISSI